MVKGQKIVQKIKITAAEQCSIWSWFLLPLCKIVISPGVFFFFLFSFFFHFFQILIFWVIRGIIGQKTVQNDKKLCQSCSNGNISRHFLYFFKLLIFQAVSGVKRQKKWSEMKKSVCHAPYLRNHASYDCHLWYTCVKW